MTQVTSALTNITTDNDYNTTVGSVGEKIQHWEQVNKSDFPALFPIDADEAKDSFAIGTGDGNMLGTLTVLVTAMVFNTDDDARRLARTNLMLDVEKALVNHAALAALIVDIRPTRIVTDKGTIPDYSIWDQEFEIDYQYDREDGG